MTVCIAAIYTERPGQRWGIWAAADRMLTSAGEEHEPDMDKMFYLGSHNVLLMAGAVQHHRRLWDETMVATKGAFRSAWSADHAASLYRTVYSLYRREMAAALHLEPLGLTLKTFTSGREGSPDVGEWALCRLRSRVGDLMLTTLSRW